MAVAAFADSHSHADGSFSCLGSTIPAFYLMTVHVHWTMDMDMDYIVQGVIPMQMVACLFFQDVPWLTFLSSNLGLRDEN